MVAHTFIPSICEAKAGGSLEFKASLDYNSEFQEKSRLHSKSLLPKEGKKEREKKLLF